MNADARLSLAAPRFHALAEAVRIAYAARRRDLSLVVVKNETGVRLTVCTGIAQKFILRNPIAMLDLAEDLYPDQPLHPRDPFRRAVHRQLLSLLPELERRLDRLVRTKDQRDVDLESHLVRCALDEMAHGISCGPNEASLLVLAIVPLLLRLDALDRAFDTHLLTGFDTLRDRVVDLSKDPRVAEVVSDNLLSEWLAAVIAGGGLVVQSDSRADWSTAIGPGGPAAEKKASLRGRIWKVDSIGSVERIR